MTKLRASLRLVLIVLWCLVLAPFPLLAVVFTLGNRRAKARVGPWLMRLASVGVCAILGVRIELTDGRPPKGASFVAPNHWGYLDVFVLGSLYPSLFVSRADVADWPIVGMFVRAGGTLFIRRERRKDAARVGGEIEERLAMGCRVTTFLEGGAGTGTTVRPFRSALLASAVNSGAPCVPVAIRYELPSDPGLDPSAVVSWIDDDLLVHLRRLAGVRRIVAKVAFLPPRTGTDRKELARLLESDVRAAMTARAH